MESSLQPSTKAGLSTGLPDPELHRSGDTIFLQALKLPRFALQMDYCRVVASFCHMLSQLYAKLLDDGVTAFESGAVALERLDASLAVRAAVARFQRRLTGARCRSWPFERFWTTCIRRPPRQCARISPPLETSCIRGAELRSLA